MSALAALQRSFIEAIDGEGAAAWPGLEVYRDTARANLDGALADTYPVVRRLVGDAFFFEAARRYARAHPSASGDLNEHGAHLAAFLAGYEHAAGLRYLPGVARLEWACHECSRSADAGPLDFAQLARVPPARFARLRFALHPAARLVRSRHPIAAIWQANQADRDGIPERAHGAEHVVVCRENLEVRVSCVDACEWDFLAALARDATLGDATSELGEAEAARVLGVSLARFVSEGVIAGFTPPAAGA
ncbi:MAG TPA: DNA-binding domain-containing protein [Usitatibacter sp.]